MNTTIPWPNPQNSLDILYYIFTGQHLAPGASWAGLLSTVQEIAFLGVLACVVFLLVFIYFHIRLEALHRAAQQRRHEEEQAIAHAMHSAAAGNPNRTRWQHNLNLMASPNPNDWRSAIMDADVMLDMVLTDRGYLGADVGEKLQSASRGPFASIDAAWESHRTRNRIAHGGSEALLSDREARTAIDGYRRVFEEFGWI